MSDVQALVNYYARAGYGRHVQTVCGEALRSRPGDPTLSFWRAFGLILEGSYSEAIAQLESLMDRREISLACVAASIHAHKMARIVDEESVDALEDRMHREEGDANERALLACANFYALAGGPDSWRARAMAERALRMARGDGFDAKTLLGWIELTTEAAGGDDDDDLGLGAPPTPGGTTENDRARTQKAKRWFDDVLDTDEGEGHLEALMGRVKVMERLGQVAGALDALNRVAVIHPSFVPAVAEKAKMRMRAGDWDAALETAQGILERDPNNIDALRLHAFYLLGVEGNAAAGRAKIGQLTDALETLEGRNARLFVSCARDLARVAGGTSNLLSALGKMLERARAIEPEDVAVLNEVAYQQQLAGNYAAAVGTYREAARVAEMDGTLDNLTSLYGTIHCQLLDGQLTEAAQQLEFLTDVASERGIKLVFLTALHAARVKGDVATPLAELEGLLADHTASVQRKPFAYDYFVHMDPDLLLQCAELYLSQESGEPRGKGEPMSPGMERAAALLEAVCGKAPGLLSAQLLLMRTRYVAGAHDAAARTAESLLEMDQGSADAHLVLSRIHLSKGDHAAARGALDEAVASDFKVRESPMFSIISAQCKVSDGDLEGGLKELEAAMKLPGVRAPLTARQEEEARRKKTIPVSVQDRATVFIMLAEVLHKLERAADADAQLKTATSEFVGTPEEVRVMIASCEMAMEKGGDGEEKALTLLSRVTRESPHYAKAKMALARIYLEKRKEEAKYIHCYQELAQEINDTKSWAALGEAFITICEPEYAISAYEHAATLDKTNDPAFKRNMAKAYVTCLFFKAAVEYMEKECRKDPDAMDLQMDLSALYIRLKKFGEAEDWLAKLVNRLENAVDTASLERGVECARMLAKVCEGIKDREGRIESLTRAHTMRKSLVLRARADREEYKKQIGLMSELCVEIAGLHQARHDVKSALAFYEEALKNDRTNVPALLALSRMRLNSGEIDACQQSCSEVLRYDADNEEASLMLAELMFQKENYETAIYHFSQLLEKNPCNYRALAQLVHLLRRCGRLDEVGRFIKLAHSTSESPQYDCGLNYCKGLVSKFENKPQDALRSFNLSRKDIQWGPNAVYSMVEIYLSPESTDLWDEEAMMDGGGDDQARVAAAESLLAEVHPNRREEPRHVILECYARMMSKSQHSIAEAMNILGDIIIQDPNNVPAVLAVCTCHMLLRQVPKARNQLKRVEKMPYNASEADEFERSWLMMADIEVQGKKYDHAIDLCHKCLKYNRSCAKAWELIGQVCEWEQNYVEASENYERAWQFCGMSNPGVGFRLAWCYLKSKRMVDCIDVCKKVLSEHPDYPKIKRDILHKAQAGLRP